MSAPRCSCQGCPACNIWPSYGDSCCNDRARSDRNLAREDMRCSVCAQQRDRAHAMTQDKGAGKGSSGTGMGAPAGKAKGKGAIHTVVWTEDDASIGVLGERLRGLTEEIANLRENAIPDLRDLVTLLRADIANLKEKVDRQERS